MIVVQLVEILWTKATRGAPRANERAALPRAYVAPAHEAGYIFQHYRLLESEEFAPRVVAERALPACPAREGGLVLRGDDDGTLVLGLRWTSFDGQPRRHPRPQALRLAPGAWARLRCNGRHTSYSGQHYSERVYNVALGSAIASDVFLARPASAEFSLAADLF